MGLVYDVYLFWGFEICMIVKVENLKIVAYIVIKKSSRVNFVFFTRVFIT